MDDQLLESQDLILVMETYHLKRLKRKFKHLEGINDKSFILLDFVKEPGDIDISDPVNFGPEIYKKTIKRVEKGVIKAIEKIIEINSS